MIFPDIPLPEEFQEINTSLITSSSDTLTEILGQWPKILVALGLVVFGWICMIIIRWVIVKISTKLRLHRLSDKIGLSHFLAKAQVKSSSSQVIAKFLGGYVFTMFFLAAAQVLNLTPVADFLDKLIYTFIPHLLVALFIVLIGFQVANTVGAIVESTMNVLESGASTVLKNVSRAIIMLFAVLAALLHLNIADDLVKILFTGVIAMIAIAGGLAFGLGSKTFVEDLLVELRKNGIKKTPVRKTVKRKKVKK